MPFAETVDQEVLESATRRFLDEHYPVDRVRVLAGAATAFEPALWAQAAQLGWTSLLAPEEAGGGSVSENGLADLIVVASQFGRHAAPGPLFGSNAVAAALGRWGSVAQQAGPLKELLAGDAPGAWAHESVRQVRDTRNPGGVTATTAGGTVVLNGSAGKVEGAADAAYLLLTAGDVTSRSQYLLRLPAANVEIVPLRGLDLSRRYQSVTLHDVALPVDAMVGDSGAADDHDAQLLDLVAGDGPRRDRWGR